MHGIATTLSSILREAVNRDIILKNPCSKVKKPKIDTPEKEALSKDRARELISLLTEGEPDSQRTGTLLALTCGLRREEICGLRWSDFSEETRCIRIRRALASGEEKPKEPKSKAGRRTIPLDERTLNHLIKWKKVQARDLLSLGVSQKQTSPIVSNTVGDFLKPTNFSRWWREWGKKNGFGDVTMHQLRHTFATLIVANGVDIVTSKTLMGHADTRMLTDLYAHVVSENASKATEMIGDILYEKEAPIIKITRTA